MRWGICDCGKWGEAPPHFDETKHFLRCSLCGGLAFLTRMDPKILGFKDKDKVEVRTVKQHE